MFILASAKVRFSSQLLHNRLAFQCLGPSWIYSWITDMDESGMSDVITHWCTLKMVRLGYSQIVISDCNMTVQKRLTKRAEILRVCLNISPIVPLFIWLSRREAECFGLEETREKRSLPQSQRIFLSAIIHPPPASSQRSDQGYFPETGPPLILFFP